MFLPLKAEQFGSVPRYENGKLPNPEGGAVNWALLVHPDLSELRLIRPNDPTVERSIARAEAYYNTHHRPGGMIHPYYENQGVEIIGLLRHEAKGGRVSHGAIIQVPYFSDSFRFAMTDAADPRYDEAFKAKARAKKKDIFSRGLVPALELAKEIGAGYVGYGKLTSSLTTNGQELDDLGILPGTSGNSYTAWAVFQSTTKVFRKLMPVKYFSRTGTLLFIGSTGAVGRPACELLAPRFSRGEIILGCQNTPASIARAKRMKRILVQEIGIADSRVFVEWDINAVLPRADVTVVATSAVGKQEFPIDWTRAKPGSCLCDISRPSALSGEAGAVEHFFAFDGSYVLMPGGFKDSSYVIYGDRPDMALACLAETAGAGLAGLRLSQSIGTDRSAVLARKVFAQLQQLGFAIAEPRWEGKVIPESRYADVRRYGRNHSKRARSSLLVPFGPLGQSAH